MQYKSTLDQARRMLLTRVRAYRRRMCAVEVCPRKRQELYRRGIARATERMMELNDVQRKH